MAVDENQDQRSALPSDSTNGASPLIEPNGKLVESLQATVDKWLHKFQYEPGAIITIDELVEKLVIFITNRDHRVWKSGFKAGKESYNAKQ